MTEMNMAEQALLKAFRGRGKARLTLDEYSDLFRKTVKDAHYDSDFGYAKLRALLDRLEADGRIMMPANKNKGYETKVMSRMPKWIRIVPEATKEQPIQVEWDARIAPMVRGSDRPRLERLAAIDAYLKSRPPEGRTKVPINTRSLHIFGNEKTLIAMVGGRRSGRISRSLSLDDLDCYVPQENFLVHEPCLDSTSRDILIIENAQSYHIFRKKNLQERRYRSVVYGGGNAFASAVQSLLVIAERLEGDDSHYFGDIDVKGFEIVQSAIADAEAFQLPLKLYPQKDLYRACLKMGTAAPQDRGCDAAIRQWDRKVGEFARQWLDDEELYLAIDEIIRSGKRVAQEWVC